MDGANMPPFPCTCPLKWNDYGYIFLAIIVTRPKYINGTLPCSARYLTLENFLSGFFPSDDMYFDMLIVIGPIKQVM